MFEDCPFMFVRWKDNKHVCLLSTFVAKQPTFAAKRYNRTLKKFDEAPVPRCIKLYNIHMGGVDLLDSIIGKSRIIMRTKKWYMRIFYHLIDFSTSNAWFLYNIHPSTKKTMLDFRKQLGTTLCKIGTRSSTRRVGRPSNQDVIPRKLPLAAPRVTSDVRYDQIGHWPVMGPKRLCKFEMCQKNKVRCQSRTYCSKCDVCLCFSNLQNCFRAYHTRE